MDDFALFNILSFRDEAEAKARKRYERRRDVLTTISLGGLLSSRPRLWLRRRIIVLMLQAKTKGLHEPRFSSFSKCCRSSRLRVLRPPGIVFGRPRRAPTVPDISVAESEKGDRGGVGLLCWIPMGRFLQRGAHPSATFRSEQAQPADPAANGTRARLGGAYCAVARLPDFTRKPRRAATAMGYTNREASLSRISGLEKGRCEKDTKTGETSRRVLTGAKV